MSYVITVGGAGDVCDFRPKPFPWPASDSTVGDTRDLDGRFDVPVHPEAVVRIPLVLERYQSVGVFPEGRRLVALGVAREVDVGAAGGVGSQGVEELPGPRDALFVPGGILPARRDVRREIGVAVAVLGALVATVGAFGPSFVFVLAFFPHFARTRGNDAVRTALTGGNAALVGAIPGATAALAGESFVDPLAVVLAGVTFVRFVRGVVVGYPIAGGGAVGLVAFFLLRNPSPPSR